MGEVKVIGGYTSLFCTRVEWALKLKGIEYEYIQEDVTNKSPLLLKYNPIHKKVPVLLHNGVPILESLNILEYIDETWKHNPLLPQDPHQRATARFWAKFNDEKCIWGLWGACVAKKGKEKEKAIESVLESFAFIEKEIEGKKYFGGDSIGYLDLVMGWMGFVVGVMEELEGIKVLEATKYPCLCKWVDEFVQVPIIKERLPQRHLVFLYFQRNLNYVRSLSAHNQ